jgi:hypothetical protein
MDNNAVISFPTPKIERYEINYNPVSHAVDIPLVPDDPTDGACILAVFMEILMESGTLDENSILQVAMQVTGNL